MRIDRIEPVFLDDFKDRPRYIEDMEAGKIYIGPFKGEEFEYQSVHLCPCGCGNLVGLHFGGTGWRLEKHDDGTITINPSILSITHPCKSHYFIRRNRVEWC